MVEDGKMMYVLSFFLRLLAILSERLAISPMQTDLPMEGLWKSWLLSGQVQGIQGIQGIERGNYILKLLPERFEWI